MKKSSTKKNIAIACFSVIVCLFLFYLLGNAYQSVKKRLLGIEEPDISTKELAKEKLNEISDMMGIQFPKSTILLNIVEDKFRDITILFKVQMSRGDLDRFLKTRPFDNVKYDTSMVDSDHYFSSHANWDWWQVDKIQDWKSCQVRFLDNKGGCRLLIDLDRPDIVVIYFVYYVT